ncbi:MAG TPA: SDR family oxidoreductase [Acidimicrobiia bacterium]|jgi:NAD(P)-dependent dehydrogenase (short-subunit alcohol dehydrogenase family)
MRTVIVGASTGLGRCLGIALAQRGAKVALLARRQELLEAAAGEAGHGAFAVTCDVTDAASCQDAVQAVVARLGGIDAVVYSTGIGVLRRIEDLDAESWMRSFETNVVGASLFTAAALPHLAESRGAIAYLSSVSASVTEPWPGLAAYTVSKAALDKLVEAWRAEHPQVGFTRVVVGDCAGGEGIGASQFAADWDQDLAGELLTEWLQRRLLSGSLMEIENLVDMVEAVLRCGAAATVPSIQVTPRRPGNA